MALERDVFIVQAPQPRKREKNARRKKGEKNA